MRKQLNFRLVLVLLLAVTLLGLSMHFLHAAQMTRTSKALLAQAKHAQENGDLDRAEDFLSRFLALEPGNVDGWIRYAQVLEKRAVTTPARIRAIQVYEQALRRDPERRDLRRKIVDLEMAPGVGLYADAKPHIEILLNKFPKDENQKRVVAQADRPEAAELTMLLGRCLEETGNFTEAREEYTQSRGFSLHLVEASARLADLLRRQFKEKAQADRVMDELIAANGQSAQAFLARARYREKYLPGQGADPLGLQASAGIAEDVARALELAPDDADVLLAAAALARKQGKPADAKRHLEHAIKLYPKRAEFYLRLADLELPRNASQAAGWLRKGIDASPGDVTLKWTLGDVLILLGKFDESAQILEELRKEGIRPELLDYLEGRMKVAQGDLPHAVKILETAQAGLAAQRDTRELAKKALLQLGECYEKLGNADLRYKAYRQAVAIELDPDPLWVAARQGLAASLFGLNKIEEAIVQYRIILPRQPDAREAMTRLLIYQNLSRPAEQRQAYWQEIDQSLADLDRLHPKAPATLTLHAEVLAAKGELSAAGDLLQAELANQPDQVELWIALAGVRMRQGKPDAALEVLKKAQSRLGDSLTLRLALVSHWSQRAGNEVVDALRQLEQGVEGFSVVEQSRLWGALGAAYLRMGNIPEAMRLWEQVAKRQPDDLAAQISLLELAMRSGDQPAAERALNQVRRLEGEEGAYWRYGQARLLMRRYLKLEPSQRNTSGESLLSEARVLLTQAGSERPGWSRVPLSEAQIDDLVGRPQAALANYLKAILELGERSPAALKRTVELLNQQQRFDQAALLLQTLQKEGQPISGELQQLAASISYQNQDYERALELAEKSVSERSDDYRELLWLGQVRAAAGRPAESVFRRAVAIAKQAPEAWLALVRYLAATGKPEEAKAALQESGKTLTQDQAALVLAQGYEALGDVKRARETYTAALAAKPNDVPLLRACATFDLRSGRAKDAEGLLHRIIEFQPGSDDSAWARRMLPLLIAMEGDRPRALKALELLGLADRTGNVVAMAAPDDLRASAKTLALQPSRTRRREAIAILEGLVARHAANEQDLFLLAQLYELDGDWTKAQRQMVEGVQAHPRNLTYLADYIRALLRHKRVEDAQVYLDTLERLASQQPGTVKIRARVLHAQGKGTEAVAALTKLAQDDPTQVGQVAALLEELGETDAALQMYQRFAAQSGQPGAKLVVAAFLGRHGRVREALDLCEAAWADVPPEAVSNASVAALYGSKGADPAQFKRVEGRLEAAIRQAPEKVSMQFDLANLRSLEGRYDEAEAIYRRLYESNKGQGSPLNNLAWMLACQGTKLSEASSLIDHAIDLDGENPDFLDTRALVQLALGHFEPAVHDLEDAIAVKPGAELYFHLAQAYLKAGRTEDAKDAFRRAIDAGVKQETLHPLERQAYRDLAARFPKN